MSALASFRTAVAALLYDVSNVIFTTTEIDQSLRWALSEYSLRRPLIRTYDFTVISAATVHTLPADFLTRQVTQVQLYDSDREKWLPLTFYAYQKDEQWEIVTHDKIATSGVLVISYSTTHQIDGLDSAAGTTIPLADEHLLQIGAAGHSAQMRASGTIESINMNPAVPKAYIDLATEYLGRFASGLFAEPGIQVASMEYPDVSMVF